MFWLDSVSVFRSVGVITTLHNNRLSSVDEKENDFIVFASVCAQCSVPVAEICVFALATERFPVYRAIAAVWKSGRSLSAQTIDRNESVRFVSPNE